MARALTPLEARVLGVLVEKHATVPDTYPLSLNTLVAGCNQKTTRDPVISATDADVLAAVDGLKSMSLVFEGSSSRVTRYEHNAPRGLNVPAPAVALLTVLMLRGPQTSAELRANAERLHRFADITAVEAVLEIGPAHRALEGHPDDVREAAKKSVRETLAPFVRGNMVTLGGSIWIVTARAR